MIETIGDFATVIMHKQSLFFSLNIEANFLMLDSTVKFQPITMKLAILVKPCLTDTVVAFVIFCADASLEALGQEAKMDGARGLWVDVVFLWCLCGGL